MIFIVIISCVCFLSVSAQESAESPEAFAARYLKVTKAGQWQEIDDLMHPEALLQLKQMFAEIVAVRPAEVGKMFFGTTTMAEYEKLTGREVFERLMSALTKTVPGVAAAIRNTETAIIGHVKEGSDLAYVVYRATTKVNSSTSSSIAVMPLKRDGTTWKALLSGNFEGLVSAFSKANKLPSKPVKPTRKR